MTKLKQLSKVTLALLVVFSLLLAGCTVPDIQPFSNATTEMVGAIRQSYSRTEEFFEKASKNPAYDEDTRKKLEDKLAEFKKVWKPTSNCLIALAAYADSLAAVAEAGKHGKDASDQLFDSLNGVLGALNLVTIPTNVTNLVGVLNDHLKKARASKSLKIAVEKASDIIHGKDGVVDILKQNLSKLEEIQQDLANNLHTVVYTKNQGIINYRDQLQTEALRIRELLTLMERYNTIPYTQHQKSWQLLRENQPNAAQNAQDALDKIPYLRRKVVRDIFALDEPPLMLRQQLDALDPAPTSDTLNPTQQQTYSAPDKVTPRDAIVIPYLQGREKVFLEKRKRIDEDLDKIAPAYQQIKAELNSIDTQAASQKRLIQGSQDALDAWDKAHLSLKNALEKKQKRPTLAQLIVLINELLQQLEKERDDGTN